ncbi:MAG: hypothetical protein ABJM29_07140 [Rhizobiaceae bacterium]
MSDYIFELPEVDFLTLVPAGGLRPAISPIDFHAHLAGMMYDGYRNRYTYRNTHLKKTGSLPPRHCEGHLDFGLVIQLALGVALASRLAHKFMLNQFANETRKLFIRPNTKCRKCNDRFAHPNVVGECMFPDLQSFREKIESRVIHKMEYPDHDHQIGLKFPTGEECQEAFIYCKEVFETLIPRSYNLTLNSEDQRLLGQHYLCKNHLNQAIRNSKS